MLNSTLVLKVNLDVRAVATAVARALLSPTGVAPALGLTGLTTRDLLGRQLSEEEAQRVNLFWDENINAILSLYRAELEHLEAGSYKMPYDLTPSLRGPGSEQWDPLNVVGMARRYMSDQERVAARRKAPAAGGVEVQQELSAEERSQYPEYYLQNFHFQSGGWLSKESAELYDYQVETLFLGSSDAMRRQVLPFMTAWARQAGGPDGEGLSLLDAACGTGRLLSFVKDNLPAMRCTAVDLSPNYLDEARRTLAPWTGDGSRLTFLNGNVEGPLPGMADASLDAVLCVYLFHELPASARAAAAAEFARLLKPGGRLFFADSAQGASSLRRAGALRASDSRPALSACRGRRLVQRDGDGQRPRTLRLSALQPRAVLRRIHEDGPGRALRRRRAGAARAEGGLADQGDGVREGG